MSPKTDDIIRKSDTAMAVPAVCMVAPLFYGGCKIFWQSVIAKNIFRKTGIVKIIVRKTEIKNKIGKGNNEKYRRQNRNQDSNQPRKFIYCTCF